MPHRIDARTSDLESELADALKRRRRRRDDVADDVAEILRRVERDGDAALVELTRQFDRWNASAETLRVPRDEIHRAAEACDSDTRDAIQFARDRIASFHRRQRPPIEPLREEDGVVSGWRDLPVDSAGLYVPGGSAAYPSSLLMAAIPAREADVERLVVATPCPPEKLSPALAAVMIELEIDDVLRLGGAQAIAALAFGTQAVNAVDIIVGPGNAWVAEAKRQLFGRVGIDAVAGPSETLIVADEAADPRLLAADLLAQAEHDPDAQAILIVDRADLADRVEEHVARLLADMPRKEIAEKSWNDNGLVIVLNALSEASSAVNSIAPEHLQLAVSDPDAEDALLGFIRHAGAIFLGESTPEAFGDYVGGPNHILPTGGSAKFSSGLGVGTFLRRSSLLRCPADGASLSSLVSATATLARAEGLEGHARAAELRLERMNSKRGARLRRQ